MRGLPLKYVTYLQQIHPNNLLLIIEISTSNIEPPKKKNQIMS